jgi:hypothetical protein
MGQSTAETVREIEDTRDRIESSFRELEERLPRPAVWTKRLVGVAVGGGVGGTLFWFGARRLRNRKKKKEIAQAIVPVQTVVKVLPDRWTEKLSNALEDGEWKGWAVLVGGAWALFRLAELRQLRRMNRVLLVGRGA